MFGRFFGGVDADAYNDQDSWADDEPDDGDLSQNFDMLESQGYDADEASDLLDALLMEGVTSGEMFEVMEGVFDHVDDGEFPESEARDDAPGVFDVENGEWFA